MGQGNAHDGIKKGKTETGKKAELGVGNAQLRHKIRTDDRKQTAVNEIHDVDKRQGREHIGSVTFGTKTRIVTLRFTCFRRSGYSHVCYPRVLR